MIQEIYIKNGLSKREAEVAELVSTGLSNKEVADKLFVTEKTIKFHLTNIYRKMNISSRTQLIVWSLPYMGFNDGRNNANMTNLNQGAQAVQPAPTYQRAAGEEAQVIPLGIRPLGKISTND
jgi:DNA-binding CsgD family transcriptional regulator